MVKKIFNNIEKEELNDIINQMTHSLHKPPYQILFGRIKINETSLKICNENQLFYEGFGIDF